MPAVRNWNVRGGQGRGGGASIIRRDDPEAAAGTFFAAQAEGEASSIL